MEEQSQPTNLRRPPSDSKKKPQGRNKKGTPKVESGSGNQRPDSKKLPSSEKRNH